MRLNDHPTHNHLTQGRVQRLKVKDQIQLAHVLKQPIQRFHVYLDQIYQRQRTLRARADNDKVQRRIVAVGDEGRYVVVRRRGGVRCVGCRLRAQERRER
jgi:hypothetical protein